MPWTPRLSVGVDLIDDQHKIWFEKAERLFQAGKNNESKEYVGELLDFLDSYTKQHFADEENYMRKINYPDFDEQKKAHSAFITQLTELRQNYKTSGGNIVVIINANKMVIDWLTKHISNMDTKIGRYAKEHQ